jgi:PAS domain S-box-containing protein
VNPPPTSELLGRLDAVAFAADAKTLRITFAAGGALARLGCTVEAATGDAQFLVKRLHPDDREQFLGLVRHVGLDGKERTLEHRMVASDGGERWFRTEMHMAPSEGQVLGLMIDATDARRTAEALRAAEARLRQVVNNAPVILFAVDKHGVVTTSEGSGLRALGHRPGQNVSRNIFDIYPEATDMHALARRALAGEEMTTTNQTIGGWWETRWTPLFDAAGAPAGFTAVSLNLTQRKEAEAKLTHSMSLLRAALEATADGILVVDKDGQIVDYNARFVELWSIPAAILEARDDERALAHVAGQLRDPEGFAAKVRALYSTPSAISHDVIEFRDGRIFERDSRPQLVDGVSVGRVWSFRDVTAQRRAERRATFLAAASKLLAGPLEDVTPLDLVARMTVPWLCDWCHILLLDDDGEARSAAAHHHDPSKIELIRRVRPDMKRRDRSVAKVIASGEPQVDNDIRDEQLTGPMASVVVSVGTRAEVDILRRLGLRARMLVPLRARGQIIGAMVFASTSAERRYDNDDLNLAMDLAQRATLAIDNQRLYQASKQAVALRDEFLSVASHELRTPVTSAQIAVQSALSVGDDAPASFLRQALASAERQTRRLGRLLDALLDVARIEAGRLELQREPVDLGVVAREAAALFAEDARRAGCELRVEAEDGIVGRWDRARIDQVVTNLLSNALKYGAGAPVLVAARRHGEQARLAVRDGGIGIAAEERSRIFERFERAVSSKHYGGLGLGLYIVRRIVDAHQGSVTIDGAPGRGAEFIVDLPLSSALPA